MGPRADQIPLCSTDERVFNQISAVIIFVSVRAFEGRREWGWEEQEKREQWDLMAGHEERGKRPCGWWAGIASRIR